jgi:hypothetical protein
LITNKSLPAGMMESIIDSQARTFHRKEEDFEFQNLLFHFHSENGLIFFLKEFNWMIIYIIN